jgi:hypothetical protein
MRFVTPRSGNAADASVSIHFNRLQEEASIAVDRENCELKIRGLGEFGVNGSLSGSVCC